jgi:hypothetical protein
MRPNVLWYSFKPPRGRLQRLGVASTRQALTAEANAAGSLRTRDRKTSTLSSDNYYLITNEE